MSGPAVPFTAADSVVLDATGAGTVSLGPAGVDWVVRQTTVSTSTAVKKPQAITYLGGVSQAHQLDASFSGDGDASDTVFLLQPGTQLYAVWTGGDVGAKAFLRLSGIAWPAGQGIENL